MSFFESIEVWHKPKTRPKGLSPEEFTSIPKTLTVRVVKYYIPSPGYRTKHVILVTTLLDPKVYPPTEIMRLYGQRWEVELDLKHLKTTLDMDILRGKTKRNCPQRNLYPSLSIQFTAYCNVGGRNAP